MGIKTILLHFKRNFAHVILVVMVLILLLSSFKYVSILKAKSGPFEEKDIYSLVNIPPRLRVGTEDENTFMELVNKKANLIIGMKPAIFYKRLIQRNPFVPLRGLEIKPVSLKPDTLRTGIGERIKFRTLNGIGPYTWRCEPEDFGTFEDNIFETKRDGTGRIIATDARGYEAVARLEVMAKAGPIDAPPPEDKVNLIYKGTMTIKLESGVEVFAQLVDSVTDRTYYKKSGDKVAGFIVREITQEKLTLFDETKGKEIELFRK